MNKLVLVGLTCLLLCTLMSADECPNQGGVSTYSDLVCQLGPFTLEFGDISVNYNMQKAPTPQIFTSLIHYAFFIGVPDVPGIGVLHPGEFFNMVVPITYIIPPCCTIADFSAEVFDLQGCCVDFRFGLDGMSLNAMNSGSSDLSWNFAMGIAEYTVPEPASLGLLGIGLAVGAGLLRRRLQFQHRN